MAESPRTPAESPRTPAEAPSPHVESPHNEQVHDERVHTEPRGARPVALAAVTVGVAVAVALGVLSDFRSAGYVLSAVLVAAALARAVLPVRVVGALAVRSRGLDVVTTGALGAALAVLARTVPA